MIRLLIIDDQNVNTIMDEVQSGITDGDHFDSVHINPLGYFGEAKPEDGLRNLLTHIGEVSALFWDVIAIDLFLGETGLSPDIDQQLALDIAEKFREQNHSSALMLYSGTISKFITTQLNQGESDTFIRRIFHAKIANFMPRSRIASEVLSAIENPSWLLRVDRLLMKYATRVVTPEEAEFKGRSFADLAQAVRRQDTYGQKIAQQVAEYGTACFADLNS